MISGEGWSPAEHRHYPPALKATARTLLLAQHCDDQRGQLSALPQELLLHIVTAAASSLSPWMAHEGCESTRRAKACRAAEE